MLELSDYRFTSAAHPIYLSLQSNTATITKISRKKMVQVRTISDPTHPAFTQRGLFSTRKVERGSHLLDYIGLVHTEQESNPDSNYDLRFVKVKDEWLSIDAAEMGNDARYINDYRGIAQRPNVEFRDYDYGGKRRMGVFALRHLDKNEELVVTYGKGFWAARNSNV
jgi:hypothetical protein